VLDIFKEPFRLKILGGYTGSGKTKVLQELEKQGETIIDLEGLANHKGSAFGNIGLPPQPTQEMFENIMGMELVKKSKTNTWTPGSTFTSEKYGEHISFIWVEDESQRIGLVNIPKDFWNTMRRSQVCFLNIPFEERLQHLIEEYGRLEKQKMTDAIIRIKERLGGLEAKKAINYLQEGNTGECFRILLKYYDKWYAKGLHNREGLNSLLHTIDLESVTPLNAIKLIQQPEYHEKS
jgi:tRNA 2-selenouridine synthase